MSNTNVMNTRRECSQCLIENNSPMEEITNALNEEMHYGDNSCKNSHTKND